MEIRVYYEDTDAGGVVYYANYLKYAERGRTEYLRALGFENSALMETHGIAFMVRRVNIEYLASGRLDDLLRVETAVETVKNSSFLMKQSIFCHDRALCTLDVTLACVSLREGKPVRLPDEVKRALDDG